jgi:DNA-binding NarL/FixJ family response regulator
MIESESILEPPRSSPVIRVFIVDDQTLFRESLVGMISSQADLMVVGQAADGEEAVRQVIQLQPDLVLMDIGLPRLDGLQAVVRIRDRLPAVKVIAITIYASESFFRRAMKAKVDSFLLKDARLEELVAAIRLTFRGSGLFNGRLMRSYLASERASDPDALTERELEVLKALAEGSPNRTIASRLKISEKTVRNHVSNIYAKLSVSGRAEAVLFAAREGLVAGYEPAPTSAGLHPSPA